MLRVDSAAATVLTAASTAVATDIILEGTIRTNAAGTIIPQVTFSAGPTGTVRPTSIAISSWRNGLEHAGVHRQRGVT